MHLASCSPAQKAAGHSYHLLHHTVVARRRMTISSPVHPPRAGHGGMRVANESQSQALERAKGYPYARPTRSFIFVNSPQQGPAAYTFADAAWVPPSSWQGRLQPLLDLQVSVDQKEGRIDSLGRVLEAAGVQLPSPSVLSAQTPLTPILAIGSNAGPEQLARKFPTDLFPEGVVVPVIRCVLRDFDVVYAPLISSYGSATATLEHSPGTSVSVFITYLTPALQQRMHETEGAYNLVRLDEVQLLEGLGLQEHESGVAPVSIRQQVYQYNHQCGTLHVPFDNPGCSPVALAEIEAAGRTFPALTQVQMQAALRAALADVTADNVEAATIPAAAAAAAAAKLQTLPSTVHTLPDIHLDAWILSNLQQASLRRARVAALSQAAKPFSYEQSEVVLVIGTSMSTSVK